MNKLIVSLLATALLATSALASDEDLTLPGERWLATFDKYICAAFGPEAEQPEGYASLNVKFEQLTTDHSLDNGLIKATFEENGVLCRYSALVLADNAAATIKLVESKAYAPSKQANCADGRAVVDQTLEDNSYLYYGHPHNLAIMVPVSGAANVCGSDATAVGVNFVVKGRI